jgi:hypothetical protein
MLVGDRPGPVFGAGRGIATVQSARPRDMGALVLVVGLLLVLVVISIAFGSPAVR